MGGVTVRRAIVTALLILTALFSACGPTAEREATSELLGANTRENAASASTRSISIIPQATVTASPARPEKTTSSEEIETKTSTPTPHPTSTAIPTPTPSVGPIPGVKEVAPGKLPAISRDLLFMAADSLRVWRSENGQVTVLATSVLDFDVASNGQHVLVLRPSGRTGDALELVLINFVSHQEQLIVTINDELADFALSPDGRQVAYIIGKKDPQGSELRPAEPIGIVGPASNAVPIIVAACDTTITIGDRHFNYYPPCGPLVWTLDSQSILWGDGAGVWAATPGSSPILLVPNEVYENDPPRLFRPTEDWSLDGRYQLLAAYRGAGSNRHVYDNETQQVIEVPNSTSGLGDVAYWIWTLDNHLFTVHTPRSLAGERDAVAEQWGISRQSLVLQSSVILPGGGMAVPAAPAQFQDGRIGFVLNAQEPLVEVHGLYTLESFSEQARLVTRLPWLPDVSPPYGQTVEWNPDGSGAIVSQVDPSTGATLFVLYASADDGMLYEVQPALGGNLHSFSWLP